MSTERSVLAYVVSTATVFKTMTFAVVENLINILLYPVRFLIGVVLIALGAFIFAVAAVAFGAALAVQAFVALRSWWNLRRGRQRRA